MQQFLKPARGAARARVIAPEFLQQFLAAVDDAVTAFAYVRLRTDSMGPKLRT